MVRDSEAKARRLAAVVFTDIVGFSAMVNQDEATGARALDLQRRVVRRLVPAFGGREIETAGDSFLLTFESAFAAVRCVAAIHRHLATECARRPADPATRLRASVHLGDIELRGRDIFGDGVNIAARLLPLAPPGGVALSDQVHSQIRHRLAVAARSIGPQQLKNIRHAVEVFVLDGEGVASIPSERVQAPRRHEDSRPPRLWPKFAMAIAAAGVIGMAVDHYLAPGLRGLLAPAIVNHRTIAVLPFASFSPASDDSLLASGVQDSVLTNLARIDDLRVISRTSVMQYGERRDRSVRQIGQELGAGVVVEGSLQRIGERLRVQVQMIDAATDRHLWAQTYERGVAELFEVESDIARQVAEVAQVKLTVPVQAAIAAAPTRSVDAYAAYLKAQALIDARDPAHYDEAGQLLARAVTLDPAFALAHVELSYLALAAYFTGADRSEAQLQRVRDELIRANELRPGLAELHRGWGNYYYYGRGDSDGAVGEFEMALQLAPNDVRSLRSIAAVYRHQGQFDKALVTQRRVVEIDPRTVSSRVELVDTLLLLHDFEAVRVQLKAITAIDPQSPYPRGYQAKLALLEGNLVELRARLKGVDEPVSLEKLAYYSGDLDEAIRQIERQPGWVSSGSGSAPYPVQASMASDLWIKGDRPQAIALFKSVAAGLRKELEKSDVSQWDQRGTLAIALAAVGDQTASNEQIRLIRASAAIKDPVTRGDALWEIAFAQEIAGGRDAALATLAEMLGKPSDHTLALTRLDPALSTLRADPRFASMKDFDTQAVANPLAGLADAR